MIISTNWATIKTKKSDNSWALHYVDGLENNTEYLVMVGDNTNQYYCRLLGVDLIEFNDDFKSGATKADSFNDAIAQIL